jgi:hypothetical protein
MYYVFAICECEVRARRRDCQLVDNGNFLELPVEILKQIVDTGLRHSNFGKLPKFLTRHLGRFHIGCPTSSGAQRTMREAAPHARGVNKARQNKATLRRLAAVKTR